MARRARARPRAVPEGVVRLARRRLRRLWDVSSNRSAAQTTNGAGAPPPVWLYAPLNEPGALPVNLPGMTALYGWDDVVRRVEAEQAGRERVRVAVYPCAPLHVLDLSSAPAPAAVEAFG